MTSEPPQSGQSPEESNHLLQSSKHKGKKPLHGSAPEVQRENDKIRQYFNHAERVGNGWLSRHELPSSAEVLDHDGDSSQSSTPVELNPNRVDGAWESKETYLSTIYELLREDALQPLREAVLQVRHNPSANEDAHTNSKVSIGIYGNVHICGFTASRRGAAVRVTFSIARIGRRPLWKQSKRLLTGSVVVLSPKSDSFQNTAIVATVAARPIELLERDPPEIDLFFARTEELEIDPAVEYVMVEERSSFYEAQRHTLCALQKMTEEPFPLSEHLVDVSADIPAPPYVQANPNMDLTAVFSSDKPETYNTVNVVEDWPVNPQSSLDTSQIEALRRILTKRLAIVQGPPGTGKTFVSVQAIKVMLASQGPAAPPIIIACQTNHAVDQLLRHVAEFETNFVRLGGMSKDREVIKPRTLFEVRNTEGQDIPMSASVSKAFKRMRQSWKEFKTALHHLRPTKRTLDPRELERLNIISKAQAESFEDGASKWATKRTGESSDEPLPFALWLGDKLVPVPPKQRQESFGFEFEETEIGYEHLRELEAENSGGDEEDFKDILTGEYYELADNFTCRKPPGGQFKIHDVLKQQDVWKIPQGYRPALYRHFQAEMKRLIRDEMRDLAKNYNKSVKERQIGRWEEDEMILKNQKIIGMTTTGLSKYRALISALGPRVVLIEEAAETLEPPVTVACLPSVQHLILVGDHRQLRPHTKLHKAFKLDISLFERMMMNHIEYSMLNKQRRMIPEIRRLLYPIYGDRIDDHPYVTDPANRPDVRGMGGINSYFFTHRWEEQRDESMSSVNPLEADMISRFVLYLWNNGALLENITVLTFYNGQRKQLLSSLRRTLSHFDSIQGIKVVTVDSYQGEENDIVILSLVRNNARGDIGFLNIDNRVCVSLSRAKCGFYMFGNAELLHASKSKTWKTVIDILLGREKAVAQCREPQGRLSRELPICCQKHHNRTGVARPEDWDDNHGGCKERCTENQPCGHPCTANCHPWAHEEDPVPCQLCEEDGDARSSQPGVQAGYLYDGDLHVIQPIPGQATAASDVFFVGLKTSNAAQVAEGLHETYPEAYHHLEDVDSLPLSQQIPAMKAQLNQVQSQFPGAANRAWQRAIAAWSAKFNEVSLRVDRSENNKLDHNDSVWANDTPDGDHVRDLLQSAAIANDLLVDVESKPKPSTNAQEESIEAQVPKDWSQEKSLLD